MMKQIRSVNKHALDRFLLRSGIKFSNNQTALERLWKVCATAKYSHNQDHIAEIWKGKGWILKVVHGEVVTVYLNDSVKQKKLKTEVEF